MRASACIALLAVCLIPLTMAVSANGAASGLIGPVSADCVRPLPTHWVSPDGLPKLKHQVAASNEPLLVEETLGSSDQSSVLAGESGRVALVIHNSIYDAINQSVMEYTQDLQAEGYSTTIYRYVSGSPESLRAYLAGLYSEPAGLRGAVLIGNIPYIIYEMMQDWDGAGGRSPEYEDFPCDIFYMDLDGNWSDALANGSVMPGNGRYDTRGGNKDLEIWVGRIKTNNLPDLGTEVSIINSYFAKAHSFRSMPTTPNRAVVYDDDDWGDMALGDKAALQSVVGSANVTSYNQTETTTSAHYKANILPAGTRWYLLRSHGYPGGHGFYRTNKTIFDYVYSSDYRNIDPPGVFYSLFVCSACDYTSSNNMGATIAFNPQSLGLLSVGSTKNGGMWYDSYFYQPMSQGNCIGESFRLWFNAVQYQSYAPEWWYGMVMLGDASLHTDYSAALDYNTLTISVNPAQGGTVTPSAGTHDYLPDEVITISAYPWQGFVFDHWEGDVADPCSASTAITLTSDKQVRAVFTQPTIAEAKMAENGHRSTLVYKSVTYVSPDCLYIEEDDCSSGIRVVYPEHRCIVSNRINVTGTVQTDLISSERYISAETLDIDGIDIVPQAVALPSRYLGGGDFFYSASPQKGQAGTTNGIGLSNIGMLVRSYGRFIPVDSTTFMIDDGTGSPVKCVVPADVLIDPAWKYIAVTGVCGCYRSGGDILPVIQVRVQKDITPVR